MILCGLLSGEPCGGSAIWLPTTEVEPCHPLLSFFFFTFLCGKDGAQQSLAGSGRIQAPFHCMPMLVTHNNHRTEGASVRNTAIFLCVLEQQNWNNVGVGGVGVLPRGASDNNLDVSILQECEIILLSSVDNEGCIRHDIALVLPLRVRD